MARVKHHDSADIENRNFQITEWMGDLNIDIQNARLREIEPDDFEAVRTWSDFEKFQYIQMHRA